MLGMGSGMKDLIQDVRLGFRILRKHPSFTALAVTTLALGIGGCTAVFSVLEARLFRPLPYLDSHQLAALRQSNVVRGWDALPVSGPNYRDWRREATAFEHLAAFRRGSRTLLSGNEPRRIRIGFATPELFPMLAVQAVQGRIWTAEDGLGVAVVSERFWRAELGGREDAVGEALTIENGIYEVIGILPEGFYFPPGPTDFALDVYVPLDLGAPELAERGAGRLGVYGRLRNGWSLDEAQAELTTIASRLARDYPETNKEVGAAVGRLSDAYHDSVRHEGGLLLGAVGFVLLIGCANIANLLLARLTSRSGEMAVRASLGAGRGRLVRQLLTESFVLAILGGAAGLAVALWGTQALAAFKPPMVAFRGEIGINLQVLGFSIAATMLSALFFGLLPAVTMPLRSPNEGMRRAGRSVFGGRSRLRSALIVGEITLSLVSLVAAGLLLRGTAKAVFESPGFNPDRLITFRIAAPKGGEDADRFRSDARERIEAIPGVQTVTFATNLPMSMGGGDRMFEIVGRPETAEKKEGASYRGVSANYFQAMGVQLLRGRGFEAGDDAGGPSVAVVNQEFVERYFPDEAVLGRRLILHSGGLFDTGKTEGTPVEVVGVVKGEKYWRLDAAPYPEILVPSSQDPSRAADVGVRAIGETSQLAAAIRAEMAEFAPTQPVYNLETMDRRIDRTLNQSAFTTILLTLFGALGLLLAAVGVYGVTTQAVLERSREMALRMAVGARPADVLQTAFKGGAAVVAIGLVCGIAGAFAAGGYLDSLYSFRGVSPYDPWVLGLAAATLLGAALPACYLPARRASKIHPMEILRGE